MNFLFVIWDKGNECWAHSSEYDQAISNEDMCDEIGIDYSKYTELAKTCNGYEFGGGEFGFECEEDALKCKEEIFRVLR